MLAAAPSVVPAKTSKKSQSQTVAAASFGEVQEEGHQSQKETYEETEEGVRGRKIDGGT